MLNMTKAQPEALTDVTVLRVGVAWKTSGGGRKGLGGFIKRAVGTDLDLACIALGGGEAKRLCWFDNLDAFDNGALVSGGDNRTGKATGDDETIVAQLANIPTQIDTLVFVVSAFKKGVSFANVEGVTLNVYNDDSGQLIGSDMPTISSSGNACAVAKATRIGAGWEIEVLNAMATAGSKNELLALGQRHAR